MRNARKRRAGGKLLGRSHEVGLHQLSRQPILFFESNCHGLTFYPRSLLLALTYIVLQMHTNVVKGYFCEN